jgi:hypothetical protein
MNEWDASHNRGERDDGLLRTFVQIAERGLSLPLPRGAREPTFLKGEQACEPY